MTSATVIANQSTCILQPFLDR